jgi:hypothetical protein
MKRLLIITTLVVASSSFALVWSANNRAADDAAILNNEKLVIESLKKRDANGFKSLVADDAILVGPEGVTTSAVASKYIFVPDYTLVNSTIEEPKVKMIDANNAILTYKSKSTEIFKGKSTTETTYATTLWVKRGVKWIAMFHQESAVPPAGANQ